MKILAIETSCDETAVALVKFTKKNNKIAYDSIGEIVHSQSSEHSQYGGVVPSIAKREHQKILPIIIKNLLRETNTLKKSSPIPISDTIREICTQMPEIIDFLEKHIVGTRPKDLHAIAVTQGPGLAPALWVGVNVARVLALLWNVPIIPVNHMEGHIVSAVMNSTHVLSPQYPVVALLVSGGHTELVLANQQQEYKKLGQTLDDAAGEAFDKTARLLGLPYPGGPEIAKLAQHARNSGLKPIAPLPRPMLQDQSLNFSYAGLKTAVRTQCDKQKNLSNNEKSALAMEFENAIVETLVEKTRRAINQYAPKSVVVGGGVSANKHLRQSIKTLLNQYPESNLYLSNPNYATDNALMIAVSGYMHRHSTADPKKLQAKANLSFPY